MLLAIAQAASFLVAGGGGDQLTPTVTGLVDGGFFVSWDGDVSSRTKSRRTTFAAVQPGRALGVGPQWHPEMMAGMVSIPEMAPGDTVWWHTDICHAVGDEHAGQDYASVIYIGSAPDCPKNRAYLPGQKQAFLQGRSAPGARGHGLRGGFQGRAEEADLTDFGQAQMGF